MNLSTVYLEGFRNYKKATLNFAEKSLIIGSNDVGKTNLIWAVRMLLDKTISEYDVEPKDSDFYAYEDVNQFKIQLRFENVVEDCVVSKLKGKISDDDQLFIAYLGFRDPQTGAKSYQLFAGPKETELTEIEDRFYRKVLHFKYISSRRDFHQYINREKNNLFQSAKEDRNDAEKTADDTLHKSLSTDLAKVDADIPKLSYIAKSTDALNQELNKLSIHHQTQKVVFDANTSNIESFINNVAVASKSKDKSLVIGGDGKLNQIYLSLWAARNEIKDDLEEVTIVCIEEPEAHLHPHQQRKLAEYLGLTLSGQVIITTHSPQIACEYNPNSIIRLVPTNDGTIAASDGCSKIIDEAFVDFGYRLSIIPAEAFFADVVFLVEGPSEELFYKVLAKQTGIDLDRLNISILNVIGVGFGTFIKVLTALKIKWVTRTDNDVSKIPHRPEYRCAGVQRVVKFYDSLEPKLATCTTAIQQNQALLTGFAMPLPAANSAGANAIIDELKKVGQFVSLTDLETDMANSPIAAELQQHYGTTNISEVIDKMKDKKAINMHTFLRANKTALAKLGTDPLAAPLIFCKDYIEALYAAN
jgi:putative ATP-dependent endonuclease of OLD family